MDLSDFAPECVCVRMCISFSKATAIGDPNKTKLNSSEQYNSIASH